MRTGLECFGFHQNGASRVIGEEAARIGKGNLANIWFFQ